MVIAIDLLMIVGNAARAEQITVQAMASWQGTGQVFLVAPGKLMILGSYSGIVFVQNQENALDTALMFCPVLQNLDSEKWFGGQGSDWTRRLA
jgi:hypothetical protein